jgi:hypothetical protein
LNESQYDERHGGDRSHAAVGRQQSDRHRPQSHHQQRAQQHGLAAQAVAEMPKHEAPERACEESDRESRKDGDRGGELIDFREKELIKNQRRDQAIDEEIIPFNRGADGTGDQNAAARTWCLMRAEDGARTVFVLLKGPGGHVILLMCNYRFLLFVTATSHAANAGVDQLARRA